MADVVCQVIGKPDQVEFIWSAGGGWFKPYVLNGMELTNFRELARTAHGDVRGFGAWLSIGFRAALPRTPG